MPLPSWKPSTSDTSAQVYISKTTSQAPSVSNTAATPTEHRRHPVQAEQDPSATPNQSGSFATPRGGGLANDSTQQNGDGVAGEESAVSGLDMRRAVSPVNASVKARMESFVDWPARGLPSPQCMVCLLYTSPSPRDRL